MGEVTATRRIGGLVLFVVGCAVVAGGTALVVTAMDRGDLSAWGFVVALGGFVVAVVLLALLAGVLARWGLRSRYTNPYGLPEHRGLARAGGAMFVVAMSLTQPLVALDLSTRTRWIVGGLLVAVVVLFAASAWPTGRANRRRVRETRKERGYGRGEQPWSWAMHVSFAVFFAAVGVLNAGLALRSDGADIWVFWAGAAIGLGFAAGAVWSAVQKQRRERRGVTRAGGAA